jgi:hypothetical protein
MVFHKSPTRRFAPKIANALTNVKGTLEYQEGRDETKYDPEHEPFPHVVLGLLGVSGHLRKDLKNDDKRNTQANGE